jgi:MFS transporter, DHA2 family, multidrug resistance protein
MSSTIDAPRATARVWMGLAVIALPCLLYSMDLTVLNLAVPHLTADLKPSSAELLWIVDIYGFLIAGFLITMGTLGNRIGRRRLLLIGAAAFGAASVLAAFSLTAPMLIAATRTPWSSGGNARPLDALTDTQHVSRREAAPFRHRRLDRQLLSRRRT